MSKLTKQQAKLHAQACELLRKDSLTLDERLFVIENWHEGARHLSGIAGAFFTPRGLARDFALEVSGCKIIDLCAGIGALAYAICQHSATFGTLQLQITCVEANPDYVAVGRKILPEARWIVADVFELTHSLGRFDCAVANSPFGRVAQGGRSPRYQGSEFEYRVIDLACDLADYGVFLIPQGSSPFRLSGTMCFQEQTPEKYQRFCEQTHIELEPNCGIDTSLYRDDWREVSIMTEIVLADFREARSRQHDALGEPQGELFPLNSDLAA